MSDTENLCISCGMCCNGTLFERVQLFDHDDTAPLLAHDANLFRKSGDESGKLYMQLPCPAHCDGACKIYEFRPSTCRGYKCELLGQVEKGGVSFEKARAIVLEALAARTATLKAAESHPALAGQSVKNILKFATDLLAEDVKPEDRGLYGELIIEVMALDLQLELHFRAPQSK